MPTSDIPPSDSATKVTVKLSPKSVAALERASRLGELNRTDTINRAIQLYDFILAAVGAHDDNALIIERNGRQERILFR